MTAIEARQAHQALLDAAAMLVEEFDEVPAGRVLRCFSRAVGHLRHHGCPTARLAGEAERLTRDMLAGRFVLDVPKTHDGDLGARAIARFDAPSEATGR